MRQKEQKHKANEGKGHCGPKAGVAELSEITDGVYSAIKGPVEGCSFFLCRMRLCSGEGASFKVHRNGLKTAVRGIRAIRMCVSVCMCVGKEAGFKQCWVGAVYIIQFRTNSAVL